MRIGSFCAGIMCGAGIAARVSEIGVSVPIVLGVWVLSGAAVSLVLEAMDEQKTRKTRRKRAAMRKKYVKTKEEYLPPGIIRDSDGRLVYACTVDNTGYKRCGDSFVAEEYTPVRKICGALAEDFSRLSEEDRRKFFEGVR